MISPTWTLRSFKPARWISILSPTQSDRLFPAFLALNVPQAIIITMKCATKRVGFSYKCYKNLSFLSLNHLLLAPFLWLLTSRTKESRWKVFPFFFCKQHCFISSLLFVTQMDNSPGRQMRWEGLMGKDRFTNL